MVAKNSDEIYQHWWDESKKAGLQALNKWAEDFKTMYPHKVKMDGYKSAKGGDLCYFDNGSFDWYDSCGFAWVEIRPGNLGFCQWLKKNNFGDNGWNGGVHVWMGKIYGGQSITLKETIADAFAAKLKELSGIKNVRTNSRLD